MPREILSDQGSDCHWGNRRFLPSPSGENALVVSSVKPKLAAVLKRELGADAAWLEFSRLAGQTSQRVQQTALAALGAAPATAEGAVYERGRIGGLGRTDVAVSG